MIQRRNPGSSWFPDLSVTLATAEDLQSLIEAVVHRYKLLGGVIASDSGEVHAQFGGGFSDLQSLAAAIDPTVLPRYFANGPFDAYVDIVAPGLIALLMRQRPEEEANRDELAMVSDYNVAKQMTEELRAAIARLGI
jgi:hypothetical protein